VLTVAGLDLAWTPNRDTGVCIVQFGGHGAGVIVELSARVGTPAGFADLIASFEGEVVAAIDAPLVIGLDRTAERQLARVFGKAKASAYTANEAFLAGFNGLAGPLLMAELRRRGFEHGPPSPGISRTAIEVFPHATHVSLFGLQERILYKKGPLATRREGMLAYQLNLAALLAKHWPWAEADIRVQALFDPEAVLGGGKSLKVLEDQLDALTCAFAGWHIATHGPAGTHIFGDPLTGLIAVPRWPAALA
jgi:predicted RNase H-like nuclease